MATNVFFNNYEASMEQRLMEDLVAESIKIYGHDVFYLPRVEVAKDLLYGEDPLMEFNSAYMVDMYVKNVDGFGGDGTFLSKFNIEIREEITFSISTRTFQEEVGVAEDLFRPREGDLIWFPLAGKLFKISFVDNKPLFYPLGTVPFFDLRCELYEFSNEKFNTGIPQIDDVYNDFSIAIVTGLLLEDGTVLVDEEGNQMMLNADEEQYEGTRVVTDAPIIQQTADSIIDFSEMDPFSEGRY